MSQPQSGKYREGLSESDIALGGWRGEGKAFFLSPIFAPNTKSNAAQQRESQIPSGERIFLISHLSKTKTFVKCSQNILPERKKT